jgi:hypothetical protein
LEKKPPDFSGVIAQAEGGVVGVLGGFTRPTNYLNTFENPITWAISFTSLPRRSVVETVTAGMKVTKAFHFRSGLIKIERKGQSGELGCDTGGWSWFRLSRL